MCCKIEIIRFFSKYSFFFVSNRFNTRYTVTLYARMSGMLVSEWVCAVCGRGRPATLIYVADPLFYNSDRSFASNPIHSFIRTAFLLWHKGIRRHCYYRIDAPGSHQLLFSVNLLWFWHAESTLLTDNNFFLIRKPMCQK